MARGELALIPENSGSAFELGDRGRLCLQTELLACALQVFSWPITKLALEAVKKEAAQDIQLGTTDQRIVVKPESVVTLNNRNYSMFVAKE